MKRESIAVIAAVASVIIGLLAWLMPFRPIAVSPASLMGRSTLLKISDPDSTSVGAAQSQVGTISSPGTSTASPAMSTSNVTAPPQDNLPSTNTPANPQLSVTAITDTAITDTAMTDTGTDALTHTSPSAPASQMERVTSGTAVISSQAKNVISNQPRDERASRAESHIRALTRDRWVHSKGSFVRVVDNQWNELRSNGVLAFQFVESSRTPTEITLHDITRDCYVRLTDTACDVKCMWWPQHGYKLQWDHYYDGSWQ